MSALTRSINVLGDLIAYPTVSSDSNLTMIDDLAERLKDAGAQIDLYRDDTGHKANLYATIGPARAGGILLAGHTDVVPVTDQDWSCDPFVMTRQADRLFGRGTCDMKGFIAACVALAPEFARHATHRPVHFAFTYDEETGCLGAQALTEHLAKRDDTPAMAIIGEPTEMRVIEGHKGCYEYCAHFHGREGHGSLPDEGVNAVEYAVRYVSRLLELREALKARAPADSPFDPPHATINIGTLQGGIATNVIPGKARVNWEMRPVGAGDADFVKEGLATYITDVLQPEMRAIWPDARIETEVIGEVMGLTPMSRNAARDLVMALTGANSTDVVSFGTEAGIFQSLGMNALVCGPGSITQAHKPDEYLDITQLAACVEMLQGVAASLAKA
ncbi:acetylornithine deacetylase [Sulfitobacter aestuariivivens]|uniref:Acetylornithine deacetylase n=1 Tax=Sulfitobacter aestuariivivens TaxID=2766981 RepID=A0A927D623_9RHOB|nr:acetylornithine deacetylase [Sulfitobacter aestuariivivens]MBD3664127.1 acetylornithine deacetylase [Sulfitobacter aestuariivivens]